MNVQNSCNCYSYSDSSQVVHKCLNLFLLEPSGSWSRNGNWTVTLDTLRHLSHCCTGIVEKGWVDTCPTLRRPPNTLINVYINFVSFKNKNLSPKYSAYTGCWHYQLQTEVKHLWSALHVEWPRIHCKTFLPDFISFLLDWVGVLHAPITFCITNFVDPCRKNLSSFKYITCQPISDLISGGWIWKKLCGGGGSSSVGSQTDPNI